MIWHKAVVVDAWKGVILAQIDQNCPMCMIGVRETILLRFWECSAAQQIWKWSKGILNYLMPIAQSLRKVGDGSIIENGTIVVAYMYNIRPRQRANSNTSKWMKK